MSSFLSHRRKAFRGGARTHSRSFDGTNDEITLPNLASFIGGIVADTYTACAWVKLDDLSTSCIFSMDETASDQSIWFRVLYSSAGYFRVVLRGNLSAGANAVNSSTYTTTDEWVHVAIVRNGNQVEGYLNGTSFGTNSTYSIGNMDAAGATMTIGAINSGVSTNGLPMTGNIADVRLFNSVVSASDLADLAAGTDYTTNMIGNWITGADEGNGAVTIEDGTANNNDGTNNGSVTDADFPY